jgi:two-component system, sensor histidine kinase and response regulator
MITLRNRRILLVDDMPAIHEDFRKTLGHSAMASELDEDEALLFGKPLRTAFASFELDSAYQGMEALDKVRASLLADRPYAMAFIDMRMPPGWDGVETIEHIWQDDPDLQIVVCTAYSDYSWREVLARLDARDRLLILKKPFDAIEVYQLASAMTKKWEMTKQAAFKMSRLEQAVEERNRDLTEAKETAERANRAKSDFLATMSHELRTPLNSIIGFSELVLAETMGPLGNEQYRGYIGTVLESGQHLLQLINDILDLAKAEAGKLILQEEDVDPHSAVESACRIMNHRLQEFGLTLVNRLPKNLPSLRTDELKLKEVLLNLLSNAVKFTPPGGRIEISTSVDASGLGITVADTGIGIAPEDFDKVFEPFGQVDGTLSRRHAGTGLGLPLVKAIMELHGGSLRLESEVGVGTRVTAQFPPERVIIEAIDERRQFSGAA